MKRLALLLLPVFAVFLMSHNVSASNTILNYLSGYDTSITGLGDTQGRIRFNDLYSISGSNASYYYLQSGQFLTQPWDWHYGHEYDVIMVLTFEVPSSLYVWNNPIYVDGDYYHTTGDEFEVSQTCDSSTCKYTIIHDIKVVGDDNGSELVKVSNFILKMKSATNISFSGKFNLAAYLIDNVDEAMAFRTNLMNELQGIHSDTTDIVDTLGEINDKLDQLDSNADANAQGWENMQNTDDLVNIGDDSQLISIVGTITTVFDSIKNAPMSESCTVSSGNTPLNMGDINLCYPLPQWVADIGSFVMTTITFAGVFFMLIGCVNAVNKFMDWARHN